MFLSRPSLLTRWPSRTTDLKNTSDDAIPNYLNSLKFRQSHTLTDVRLALGYSAFGIAAACFLWDYKLGFENTKHFTAAAVAVYTLVNTALTLWITFREKGVIYEGTSPSGEKVRHSPVLHIPLLISPPLDLDQQLNQEERPYLQPRYHHHRQQLQVFGSQALQALHWLVRRDRPVRRNPLPGAARHLGSPDRKA